MVGECFLWNTFLIFFIIVDKELLKDSLQKEEFILDLESMLWGCGGVCGNRNVGWEFIYFKRLRYIQREGNVIECVFGFFIFFLLD